MTKNTEKLKLINSMIRINLAIVIVAVISTVYFYNQYKSEEKEYLIDYPGGFASLHGAEPIKILLTKENRNDFKRQIEYAKRGF